MTGRGVFLVRCLRLTFLAKDAIFFPVHKPGNILRGAFGILFRELACRCPGGHAKDCAYARIFEPKPLVPGPSGFADLPRPFVFRAAHLDGKRIAPGERFHFEVNLFTRDPWPVKYFEATFAKLASEGLGPGRGRAWLEGLDHSVLEMSLSLPAVAVDRLTIQFVTPTELKAAEGWLVEPSFEVLMARLRDRISNLGAQYGDGPLETDFREFAGRARRVAMVECDLQQVDAERTSGRTGQTHPLSGFTGRATYSGDLTEFLPYLQIGQYTGVGRQTVWGKGELRVVRESGSRAQA